MVKQRIRYIDALKFFAIFLVLWGHSVQHLLTSNPTTEPVYRIIYTFHMPLFMMLSGFFASGMARKKFTEAFINKFRQLLLPLITITAIWLAVNYFQMGGGNPLKWFWFLKSAFICSITYLITTKCGKYSSLILIITLIGSYFIREIQINKMYPCFVAGVYLNRYYPWLVKNAKKLLFISFTLFLTILICKECEHAGIIPRFDPGYIENRVLRITAYFFLHLRAVAIGLAGSITLFIIFMKATSFFENNKAGRFISGMGQHTLGIYIFQTFILELILKEYLNFDEMGFVLFNFVIAPLISLVVAGLCIMLIKNLKKIPLLSFLLLGSAYRSKTQPNKAIQ